MQSMPVLRDKLELADGRFLILLKSHVDTIKKKKKNEKKCH